MEAPRIAYPLRSRTRFSEAIGAEGREARAQLISHAVEDADRTLAKRLALKTGAPLVRLETVRFADRAGLDPIAVIRAKMEKNRAKYPVERARGRAEQP